VADAGAGRRELAAALRDAVDGLSETLRLAFVLVRLGGRSQEDAASILDVPVGTVKSRVAAAEADLRGRLARFR
jgi:RNA polymerase sigma-70 factor (ECF subfamily)